MAALYTDALHPFAQVTRYKKPASAHVVLNIEALYFPIPQQYLGSGRGILQPKGYIHQIPKIIQRCNSLNITPQLLLNVTCEGESGLNNKFFDRLVSYIKKLRDLGLGSLVITNPVYIGRIKKEISGIRVESSVNCYAKTIEHAAYLKDLGVDVLTIDRDINRNIPLIKEIKNRLHPKTISWWNPETTRLHKYDTNRNNRG